MTNVTNYIPAIGMVTFKLYKPNGEIIERQHKNLVVQVGLDYITSRMTAATANVMSHMGLGLSTISPNLSDSALKAPVGSRANINATVLGNNITYVASFPSGPVGAVVEGAITEAGIFNAPSAGTMLSRTTFPPINKSNNDTLSISWVITIGQLG